MEELVSWGQIRKWGHDLTNAVRIAAPRSSIFTNQPFIVERIIEIMHHND
jgi:hypothetical protein